MSAQLTIKEKNDLKVTSLVSSAFHSNLTVLNYNFTTGSQLETPGSSYTYEVGPEENPYPYIETSNFARVTADLDGLMFEVFDPNGSLVRQKTYDF